MADGGPQLISNVQLSKQWDDSAFVCKHHQITKDTHYASTISAFSVISIGYSLCQIDRSFQSLGWSHFGLGSYWSEEYSKSEAEKQFTRDHSEILNHLSTIKSLLSSS